MTLISAHFSLEELTVTLHRDIDNSAPADVLPALRLTALSMEQVRQALGDRVITVSSGYRCPELNRAVGGSPTSAHITGHAVDFNCYSFGSPLEVCRKLVGSSVKFDQLIEEGTWVHISFDPRLRGQVLTKHSAGGYGVGLPET
jgi:zinc D-Ala-D-Ala carboxypeptidase